MFHIKDQPVKRRIMLPEILENLLPVTVKKMQTLMGISLMMNKTEASSDIVN